MQDELKLLFHKIEQTIKLVFDLRQEVFSLRAENARLELERQQLKHKLSSAGQRLDLLISRLPPEMLDADTPNE